MKPVAVMQVEGVLRRPGNGAVLESGQRLYHGLAGTFRIVLVTEEANRQHLTSWLGMEGFSKHDHVVYLNARPVGIGAPWLNTVRTLKNGHGYDVDLTVLTDPREARVLIEHGYSTVLFTQAAYSLPEWRPDHKPGVRPWDDLTAEIETQCALRAADKRMEDDLK